MMRETKGMWNIKNDIEAALRVTAALSW